MNGISIKAEQGRRMRAPGFIAALDQSGGSTPGALEEYGIARDAYSGDAQMFDLVHAFRARVVTDAAFTQARILATILFVDTMRRSVNGMPTARFLWERKGIIPFLKIDKGLEPQANGVQLMKVIPGLDATLSFALEQGAFGTKERSVIRAANAAGISALVHQQFELARTVLEAGLVPILEPEVDITIPDKDGGEQLLLTALLEGLETLDPHDRIMVKVSIPNDPGRYAALEKDPRVLRVVALSGGYPRDEACARLAATPGLTASFSRALLDGLRVDQSNAAFHATLEASIQEIFEASTT